MFPLDKQYKTGVWLQLQLLWLLFFSLNGAAEELTYSVKKTISLPVNCFTQGFLVYKQHFFLSCGHYGRSRLVKLDLNGRIIREISLPDNLFAEGISIIDNQLYMLSWKEQTAYVFDAEHLTIQEKLSYSGEGWGLTTDSQFLVMSNGSPNIQYKHPANFSTVKTRMAIDASQNPLDQLNELEQIADIIIANIWQSDIVVLLKSINSKQLQQIASINLSAIKSAINPDRGEQVLNGIAYDSTSKCLWITGKEWGKAYALAISANDKTLHIDIRCDKEIQP